MTQPRNLPPFFNANFGTKVSKIEAIKQQVKMEDLVEELKYAMGQDKDRARDILRMITDAAGVLTDFVNEG